MEYLKLIDELIHELSYRVGVPDLKNKEHQSIISEILTEWGKIEEKYRIMSFLTEAPQDKKLDQSKADTEGDDKDYSHIGRGIYVRKGDEKKKDSQKYKKSDSGQLQAITPDEYEKLKGDQGEEGEKAAEPKNAQTAAQAGGEETEQPETGTALNKNTKSGKSYHDDVISKEEETRAELDAEKSSTSSDSPEFDKEKLLKKDHDTTDTQLNMTAAEAAAQAKQKGAKDVGAGTAESRAGEAMVHKGIRLLKEGSSLKEVEQYFKELVNQPGHILNSTSGKKWVKSAAASLRKIDEVIGIENIEDVAWDTKDGRTALGIDVNLETSSDMFVKTSEGKVIGISLKKDGKVFLANGGWAKQSELLLKSLKNEMSDDDHEKLSDAMSIKTYQKDLEERFQKTTETITPDILRESVQRLIDNPQDQGEFQGSSRDAYFRILANPELLLKRIKMGTTQGNDQKAYAKLLQAYHPEEYNYLREADNGLTKRAFDVLNKSPEAKRGMNKHIIKSMHIMETLGFDKNLKEGGVDGFMTVYGIEPDGAVLNEQTLITLLGDGFKQKLQESIKEVRDGKLDVKELEEFIVNSIEIDYESGEILFKHESNKKFPLFKLSGRTRGIGSSPVMEMVQTPFMAHALKMGTFNTDEWDAKSLQKFKKDIIDSETN